jgi:hypothetical protein
MILQNFFARNYYEYLDLLLALSDTKIFEVFYCCGCNRDGSGKLPRYQEDGQV